MHVDVACVVLSTHIHVWKCRKLGFRAFTPLFNTLLGYQKKLGKTITLSTPLFLFSSLINLLSRLNMTAEDEKKNKNIKKSFTVVHDKSWQAQKQRIGWRIHNCKRKIWILSLAAKVRHSSRVVIKSTSFTFLQTAEKFCYVFLSDDSFIVGKCL